MTDILTSIKDSIEGTPARDLRIGDAVGYFDDSIASPGEPVTSWSEIVATGPFRDGGRSFTFANGQRPWLGDGIPVIRREPLVWDSEQTDDPGVQRADSRLNEGVYWVTGPDQVGRGQWCVNLVERTDSNDEPLICFPFMGCEAEAKRAAQEYETGWPLAYLADSQYPDAVLVYAGPGQCPGDDGTFDVMPEAVALNTGYEILARALPRHHPSADRELSFDEAEARGLDGTGRDGDPRFPHKEPAGDRQARVERIAKSLGLTVEQVAQFADDVDNAARKLTDEAAKQIAAEQRWSDEALAGLAYGFATDADDTIRRQFLAYLRDAQEAEKAAPDWVTGAHIHEAHCRTCGETFNPAGPDDLVHLVRNDGEPCGGPGEYRGGWLSSPPPPESGEKGCPDCGAATDLFPPAVTGNPS